VKTPQRSDLLTELRDLKRRVSELERGRTLSSTTISRGTLEVRNPATGTAIFSAGELGTGKWGITAYRADGTRQFQSWDDAAGNGYTALFDEAENILLSSDTVSGSGIARPYLDLPVVRWADVLTPPDFTISPTFASLFRVHGRRQQPKIEVMAVVKNDAGTVGEIQLVQGASVISDVTPIADGAYAYLRLTGTATGAHMSDLQIDVQARRVSGAGNVRVLIVSATGRQS